MNLFKRPSQALTTYPGAQIILLQTTTAQMENLSNVNRKYHGGEAKTVDTKSIQFSILTTENEADCDSHTTY